MAHQGEFEHLAREDIDLASERGVDGSITVVKSGDACVERDAHRRGPAAKRVNDTAEGGERCACGLPTLGAGDQAYGAAFEIGKCVVAQAFGVIERVLDHARQGAVISGRGNDHPMRAAERFYEPRDFIGLSGRFRHVCGEIERFAYE